MTRFQTAVAGGLLAGLFDIIDALIWGYRTGVKPMRLGQSIASGLMGEAARHGGWGSCIVGFALHFALAILMALIFYGLARRYTLVARHAVAFSSLYGVILYLAMTYAIVPLSLAYVGQHPKFPPALDADLVNALFCHIVLLGLTIGIFTRRAMQAEWPEAPAAEWVEAV